jgi:hypothetical protein
LEQGRVVEKTGEGKTRWDPATRQDQVKNSVATCSLWFFFILKRRYFDLKIKKIDPDDPVKI